MTELLREALPIAVQACFVYLLATYAMFLALLAFAALENVRRRREARVEDYALLAESRYSIPVSVIIPAFNEAPVILSAVRSALAFEYAEIEVIVVNDGSADDTVRVLVDEYAMRPFEVFHRRALATEQVRAVYRSDRDPRLLMVDKANGGKADALNAGVNLARFRYVCCLDGDTVYEPDALLKGMRLAVADPARVVGVTSVISVASHPETHLSRGDRPRTLDRSLLSNFQHIDYLRSFLNTRAAWSRLDFMLCAVGAFMIWRRDLVVEVGGFSRNFTCEDIELTFRVYERLLREGRPCKVVALPDTVATTEGPNRVASLISQRARWQRVILETVWHYRKMMLNPRYGAVGLLGMPFYFVTECIAPFFEVASVLTLALAVALGVFDLPHFAAFVAAISLLNASFTIAALVVQDRLMREMEWRDLLRLVLVSPLELLLYRPWLTVARVKGTIDSMRGRKTWNKFERNARAATAALAVLACPAIAAGQDAPEWTVDLNGDRAAVSLGSADTTWWSGRAQLTRRREGQGGAFVAVEPMRRFGFTDITLIAAAWRHRGPWSFYGEGGVTPEADFHYRRSVEVEAYRRVGQSAWVPHLGYRYWLFPGQHLHLVSPRVTRYGARSEVHARLMFVRNTTHGTSSTSALARAHRDVRPRLRVGAGVAKGERIFDVTSLPRDPAPGWVAFVEGRVGVGSRDSVGVVLRTAEEGSTFDQAAVGLSYRRRF